MKQEIRYLEDIIEHLENKYMNRGYIHLCEYERQFINTRLNLIKEKLCASTVEKS